MQGNNYVVIIIVQYFIPIMSLQLKWCIILSGYRGQIQSYISSCPSVKTFPFYSIHY